MRVVCSGWSASRESSLVVDDREGRCWVTQVEQMESAGIGREEECLRAEGVDHGRRIDLTTRHGDGDLASDSSSLAVSSLDKTVSTSGIELTAVDAVCDVAAATLMSPGAPCGLDHVCAIAASPPSRVLWYSILVQRWQLQGRDMAAAETDRDQWLGGVHRLGEKLPRQRQRADILEHCGAMGCSADVHSCRAGAKSDRRRLRKESFGNRIRAIPLWELSS
jgi:hypothetical protein